MKKLVGILLCIFLLLGVSPVMATETDEAGASPRPTFSDVPENAWYAEGVAVCVQAGLMEGTGDGQFSPQLPLSQAECMTLALRLYDLNHGGDGLLPHAPESWSLGSFTLIFDDGTELSAHVSDLNAVDFYPAGIQFFLDETQTEWVSQRSGAAVTLRHDGKDYAGSVEFRAAKNGLPTRLLFPVDSGTPFHEVYEQLSKRQRKVPGPDAWYRDAWYYLEQHELDNQFQFSFQSPIMPAREQFCYALFHAAGALTAINEVETIPDFSSDSNILALYQAGILTGQDSYGTFVPGSSLSRAEAATLCARVLRPDLRVRFTPTPLPETGYTLTLLTDGDWSGAPTSRICLVDNDDVSYFITLDGKRVDWPEGHHVPSGDYDSRLDHIMMGTYLESFSDIKRGVMDGNGTFVVPLRTYDWAYPTGDGHFVVSKGGNWLLLGSDGSLEAKLPTLPDPDDPDNTGHTWQHFNEGLVPRRDSESGLYGYAGVDGQWVLAPQWRAASSFSGGYASVADQNDHYGIIDHSGNLVIPMRYQELSLFQNSPGYTGGGYFRYTDLQGQTGWLSTDGTAYSGAPGVHHRPFNNGYAAIDSRDDGVYYLGSDLRPASQKFDWGGPIGADGRGFVGLDGKIYRIEF